MEKLLVFIPAYNCEKQVTRVLSQLLDQRIAPWVGECIVVNNRSADGTEAAVQDWMARHPAAPVRLLRNDQNYGLGGSHKVAFGYAAAHGYEHLVVLHGDDQGAIADLLPILNDGTYKKYDCCLGSRFMKGSKTGGYSALRTWGNYGFNWLFSLVARKKITDLGSGLNLYAVEPLKNEYYKKFPDTLYFNDCMIPGALPDEAAGAVLPHQLAGGGPGQQQQADELRHQSAQALRQVSGRAAGLCGARMARENH